MDIRRIPPGYSHTGFVFCTDEDEAEVEFECSRCYMKSDPGCAQCIRKALCDKLMDEAKEQKKRKKKH